MLDNVVVGVRANSLRTTGIATRNIFGERLILLRSSFMLLGAQFNKQASVAGSGHEPGLG